jgi:hypothetical protein
MWPFRRTREPLPDPVSRDGVTATCHFDRSMPDKARWDWTVHGTSCTVWSRTLPDDWLERTRRALATMEALGPEIRIIVLRHLQGWGPPDAAVFSLRLVPEEGADAFEVLAESEAAWGDLGVAIQVAHGRITSDWAGD